MLSHVRGHRQASPFRSVASVAAFVTLTACGGSQHTSEFTTSEATEEQHHGEGFATGGPADEGEVSALAAERTPPRLARITFLDVGQGDAILIQVDDVDILIDGGPALGWGRSIEQAANHLHGDLEVFFVTHPHDDHFFGAVRLFDTVRVRRVITNGEGRGPPRDDHQLARWSAFVEAVDDAGLELEHLDVGDTLRPAEGLTLHVLATGSPTGGEYRDTSRGADINNDSLVMMLEFGGRRVLLTGDIQNEAQQALVERQCEGEARPCEGLRADVLKVPHHGSSHSEVDFFRAVGAPLAVISADFNNRNGRHCLPRLSIVEALHGTGAEVLSTSSDGTDPVIIWLGADGSITRRAPPGVFAWDASTSPCSGQTLERRP